jgi:hypothetical protein
MRIWRRITWQRQPKKSPERRTNTGTLENGPNLRA